MDKIIWKQGLKKHMLHGFTENDIENNLCASFTIEHCSVSSIMNCGINTVRLASIEDAKQFCELIYKGLVAE